jgi:hypothetical protein
MTVTIKIKCDNAAFEDGKTEVARLLELCANEAKNGQLVYRNLFDSNGNRVGEMKIGK